MEHRLLRYVVILGIPGEIPVIHQCAKPVRRLE
jgi:hypothetical protein